jgi:Ulp1 family protease
VGNANQRLGAAVTVKHHDLERLEFKKMFNDVLVMLKMRIIFDKIPEWKQKKIYLFDTYFYDKLVEGKNHNDAYNKVKRWTKKIDIFAYDYILIPINQSLHWSLFVISKIHHTMRSIYDEKILKTDNETCFFHLDSLNLHPINLIREKVINYLANEWNVRKVFKNSSQLLFTDKKNLIYKNPTWQNGVFHGYNSSNNIKVFIKDHQKEEILFLDENLYKFRTTECDPIDLLKTINCFRAKCPSQGSNGTECGVYTVKYFEKIVELFPSTKLTSQREQLRDVFHDFEFTLNDSKEYRLQFKKQIEELRKEYLESQRNNNN